MKMSKKRERDFFISDKQVPFFRNAVYMYMYDDSDKRLLLHLSVDNSCTSKDQLHLIED
jgi:hypothetical protein